MAPRLFVLLHLVAVAVGAVCVETEHTLCLAEDRFRAELEWTNPLQPDEGGVAQAIELTDETGFFWFLSPANVELVLKVLDGQGVNDHHWVFLGSLSRLELIVTVTDTELGWQRSYRNPPLEQTAASDTLAFRDDRLVGDVVFFGAHPDDEVLASPVLGTLCVERGASCSLVVATRGENGTCRLPSGCSPDLATVRSDEMVASAALLGATLDHWQLPDGPSSSPQGVRAEWAAHSGGERGLLDRISTAIDPGDVVITFDPRHGSTCHGDHRALGGLVLDVWREREDFALYLLETRGVLDGGAAVFTSVAPGDRHAIGFDATLAMSSGTAWAYVVATAEAHASQFPADVVTALAAVDERSRRVVLLPAAFYEGDPRYAEPCGD